MTLAQALMAATIVTDQHTDAAGRSFAVQDIVALMRNGKLREYGIVVATDPRLEVVMTSPVTYEPGDVFRLSNAL